MDKTYNPEQIEQKWYETWEKAGYFKSSDSDSASPYCVILPPPNVTGTLHMGHGFQATLMDTLIRYQRMSGKNTLWQPGTDHAGIATQMVVERELAKENIKRTDLGREAFLEKVWEWKETSGNKIHRQFKRMGASLDWSRERFSMDPGLCDAVKKAFIQLHEEGLIYRGKRLVNWDPHFQTAISDLEVITEEEQTSLTYIHYPIEDSKEFITVATTRPETLLGDTAVAVHPDDKRYKHLIGKNAELPLTDRLIPIIADKEVEIEFGTGCVKITPAHDFNDYAMGQRHKLEMINILTPDAHINENAPEAYRGLERFEARKKVLVDLEALKLLEKTEDYMQKKPRGDRSGVIVEPYLTDQWFVKAEPLAKPAIAAVKNGDIKFTPENWTKTYYQWLENIEDWCISRQLWWGHRIPAWYDEEGNIYVAHDEEEVRSKNKLSNDIRLTQDTDVLDTWFSAMLWPMSTLGWPEKTPELETFYPTSVLVTGFDIIFFWVARMIMAGLKFMGEVPFKEVYITGLIRDSHGKKMSKSKGNVLDPIDLVDGVSLDGLIKKRTAGLMQPKMAKIIEKNTKKEFPDGIPAFGTDATRFTYCALATTGRDIRFDLGRVDGYRNFCNKLWNASRYVLMNTENKEIGIGKKVEYTLADKWILSRLEETIQPATIHLDNYRFDLFSQTVYEFTWHHYCDWYLELSKPVLNDTESSEALVRGTRQTLIHVLETILRLLHPAMPFITEEIWHRVAPLAEIKSTSIMLQEYPVFDKGNVDKKSVEEMEWVQQLITHIRTIRAEMNIPPSKPLPLLLNKGNKKDRIFCNTHQKLLIALAKLSEIAWLEKNETPPASATAVMDELEILIPMEGLIDKKAESERLNREIMKLKKEIDKCQTKLDNPNYIKKAPAEVVQQEKERVKAFEASLSKYENQLKSLQ